MSRRGEQDGFTLIELLIAMTLGLLVTFGILQSSDLFFKHAGQQTRVLDGNDQVRTLMDRTVQDLQGAATIVSAGSQDLIYTLQTPSGLQTKRLCVAASQLYGVVTTAPAPPPTVGTPCTSGARIATLKTTSSTAFTYDGAASSATPATVHNVGLTFSLDTTSPRQVSATTLTASASRRLGTLLVCTTQACTDPPRCTNSGAILPLTAVGSTGPVTITYKDLLGNAVGTGVSGGVQISSSLTQVVATFTDAAGLTTSSTVDTQCGQ